MTIKAQIKVICVCVCCVFLVTVVFKFRFRLPSQQEWAGLVFQVPPRKSLRVHEHTWRLEMEASRCISFQLTLRPGTSLGAVQNQSGTSLGRLWRF